MLLLSFFVLDASELNNLYYSRADRLSMPSRHFRLERAFRPITEPFSQSIGFRLEYRHSYRGWRNICVIFILQAVAEEETMRISFMPSVNYVDDLKYKHLEGVNWQSGPDLFPIWEKVLS